MSAAGHPSEALVQRYLGGQAREHAATIEAHIDACAECREWLARLARTSVGVSPATPDDDDDDGDVELGEFLPVGTMIDRFEVIGELGRGGAGAVYRVRDARLGRTMAIKVLRRAITGVPAARLLAEARTMARVVHPNVCQVFDVGCVDDRWYIVMPSLPGTLAQWLAAAEHSVASIVDVFTQAARGLEAAHRLGVVHRDFKPSNVLVVDGHASVSDFGLAATEHDTTLPSGGTPHYMAPEQREGRGDARVDQYAWGVALHDALQARTISGSLRAAIDRARASNAAERFDDMTALLRAVERASRPQWRRALPLTLLAAAAIAAAVLPRPVPASVEPPALQDDAPPEVGASVQLLLDDSFARSRALDAAGSLAALDEAAALAESTGDQAGLALALSIRGSQLGELGRPNEAIEQLERAFVLASRIGRPDIAADAAIHRVGLLADVVGDTEAAITWGRHAEATLARMADVEDRLRSELDMVIGRIHHGRGEHELAQERMVDAVARLRANSPTLDRYLVRALIMLGQMEFALDREEAARAAYVEAIDLGSHVLGSEHPDVATAYGNLATVDGRVGDFDAAMRDLARARELLVASYGEGHPDVLAVTSSEAAVLMRTGRYPEAITMLERALVDAPSELDTTCGLFERLAYAQGREGAIDVAHAGFLRARDCYAAIYGPDSPHAADVELGLSELGPLR